MPENQKTSKRKRTSSKKRSAEKARRIAWAVIIVVAAILVVLKVWEIDFNSIKNKLNSSGIVSSIQDDTYPIALDSSKSIKIFPQNDKLNIMTDISCSVLNPKNGEIEYSFNHGYSNPVLSCAGGYFCLVDQGARRFRLDTLNEPIYELTTDTAVLCAAVADNGSVVYAVSGDESKSHIVLIDKGRKKHLDFDVNSGYVVSVAIDSSGKRCAYATVNSTDAKMITTVHTVDIGDKSDRGTFDFESSDVLSLKYNGSDLFIICNDSVSFVSNQKKLKEVFKKGEVNTCCFNYNEECEPVYVYSKYSSANENYLACISGNGKVKTTIELSQRPKYVSAAADEATVLFTDRIVTYSVKNGEELGSAVCDDAVNIVHKLSTKCFICRHQVVDVAEIKLNDKD